MLTVSEQLAPDGKPFQVWTLTNANGMSVQFCDWGATWLSCRVPVGGELREVLLGCRLDQLASQTAYLGATVGRFANRLANARLQINGKIYPLVANQGGKHQLHGGEGFSHRRWQAVASGQNVVEFCLTSPDGDQGYPGTLHVSARYTLCDDNTLVATFVAESDQDTACNLTNHAYFNLDGVANGDVRDHWLQLSADRFLPVDNEGIPNAPLKAVSGTAFDFRQAKPIRQDFGKEEQAATKGYDHSFLLSGTPAAVLTAADRSLRLVVETDQPAIQVYTGNYLGGVPSLGGEYRDFAGVALETQCLPDSPNHPEWQQGILKAGEQYQKTTRFRFELV